MTTPVLKRRHRERMPSMGRYHTCGLESRCNTYETCLANELQPINHFLHVYRNFGEHCFMCVCEWCNILLDQMDDLRLSMPMHCTDCIASPGRETMY
ncbi:hypothetical protein TNCV_3958571 [Trichonephila clavipes]|nr:hypothetical protein TNCV_3958571 [Trichonephila clavipes]